MKRFAERTKTNVGIGRRAAGTMRSTVIATAVLAALVTLPQANAHEIADASTDGILLVDSTQNIGCLVTVTVRHFISDSATVVYTGNPSGPGDPTILVVDANGTAEPRGGGFRYDLPATFFPESDPLFVASISAHGSENHRLFSFVEGDECRPNDHLYIHASPDTRATNPIRGCDLWVEGDHMRATNGTLIVRQNEVDIITHEVKDSDSTPEEDGIGTKFFIGPLTVPGNGEYHVLFVPQDRALGAGVFDLEVKDCVPIPFFGSPLMLGAAGVVGLIAFASIRRRT